MSDMLKHVVVADMLGEVSAYSNLSWLNNRAIAFITGFLSHIVLDYIDNEFVVNWFNIPQLRLAIPFLIFQLLFVIIIIHTIYYNSRKRVSRYSHLRICFIIGAVIPDIIDGIYTLFSPQAWYTGTLLFPWHRIGDKTGDPMSMYNTILISSIFVIIRYVFFKKLKRKTFPVD
ncbi:MAG: hypothetical protein ACOCP5_04215 [Halanaerobiaceae bacterium]